MRDPLDDNLRTRLQKTLGAAYDLERELGGGGMSRVFLAHEKALGRRVVIKVLASELAAEVSVERFRREVELAARLQHPHIVPLLAAGQSGDVLYYTMPFIDGESLRDRLTRERQLPIEEAVRLAREVADALAFAHARGVIHRDIKPENILLSAGHAVVTDFGIARALDSAGAERLTSTGLSLGTPAYMSPEQAVGEPADARSDVYSLALVLYEMLVGDPPFAGTTPQAVIARRLAEPPPRASVVRRTIPSALEAALQTGLATLKADRFVSAEQFSAALSRAVGGATAPTLARPRQATQRWIAAAVLLVAGFTLWTSLRSSGGLAVRGTRLAVLPFAVHGAPGMGYLSHGLVDLMSRNLDGFQRLEAVDPGTILSAAKRSGTEAILDAAEGRALAGRLGAQLFVVGSVYGAGNTVRMQATLYEQDSDQPKGVSQASVEGDTMRLLHLVDSLSAQLIAGRQRAPGMRHVHSAAATTQSLGALKSYLEAEEFLRDAVFDSARTHFQEAVAQDSNFALAYYRLAVAAGQRAGITGEPRLWEISAEAAARAVSLGGRLGDRDRRLLAAYADFLDGKADEAERSYRGILEEYPGDLEATFMLGEVLFHYNAPRGRPRTEARAHFEHVMTIDPAFLCPS